MGSITGYTAEKMQEIVNGIIVGASVVSNHLILEREDGSTIDAGSVLASSPPLVDTPAELAALELGDGIEAYYEVSTSIRWHLRYDLANDRWNKVGGPPILSNVDASEATSSGGIGDQNLTTLGPSITPPLIGSYLVQVGGRVTLGAASLRAFHSYAIGASSALQSDAGEVQGASGETLSYTSPVKRKALILTDVLVSKYRDNSGSASATFADRWMRIDPEFVTT